MSKYFQRTPSISDLSKSSSGSDLSTSSSKKSIFSRSLFKRKTGTCRDILQNKMQKMPSKEDLLWESIKSFDINTYSIQSIIGIYKETQNIAGNMSSSPDWSSPKKVLLKMLQSYMNIFNKSVAEQNALTKELDEKSKTDFLSSLSQLQLLYENYFEGLSPDQQWEMFSEWFEILQEKNLRPIYTRTLLRQEFPVLVKYPEVVQEMADELLLQS